MVDRDGPAKNKCIACSTVRNHTGFRLKSLILMIPCDQIEVQLVRQRRKVFPIHTVVGLERVSVADAGRELWGLPR